MLTVHLALLCGSINCSLSRCIAGANWDPALLNKAYRVSDSRLLDVNYSTVRV